MGSYTYAGINVIFVDTGAEDKSSAIYIKTASEQQITKIHLADRGFLIINGL